MFVLAAFAAWVYSASDQVRGIKRSYEGGSSVAQSLYKSSNWFSSAYTFPSSPIFALPGAYRINERGIEVSIPTKHAAKNTMFGSFTTQCIVGFGQEIGATQVKQYSDWSVVLALQNARAEMAEAVIQVGSPWLYLTAKEADPVLSCEGAQVSERPNSSVFTLGDQVFLQQKQAATGQYRIGLLPNATDETIELFEADAWPNASDTYVQNTITDGNIQTTYMFGDSATLITVWPHQASYLDKPLETLATYQTQLGELSLVSAQSFTTVVEKPDLPANFTVAQDPARQEEIRRAIVEDVKEYSEADVPQGAYFRGTWLGAASTLALLSDTYGLEQQRKSMVDLLQQQLKQSTEMFFYDDQQHMYIAKKPEFGNEEGNDHHFHYGYYIRSAAVLSQLAGQNDPDIAKMIDQMVADIATFDSDDTYPRLRHYSVYEGHSWADGDASFEDGNNQESTSEALNAWYGIYLWGVQKDDQQLSDLGQWLFSQELAGTKAYWFGYENPFPSDYVHDMASIVWGGKRDFATWFSGEKGHIYGIQLLPITPASSYLSQISIPTLLTQSDNDLANHEWRDLLLAYQSYHNPSVAQEAASEVDQYAGTKLQSLFLQTVYSQNGQ